MPVWGIQAMSLNHKQTENRKRGWRSWGGGVVKVLNTSLSPIPAVNQVAAISFTAVIQRSEMARESRAAGPSPV